MEKTFTKFENLHQVLNFIQKLDKDLEADFSIVENELTYLADISGDPESINFFPDNYQFNLHFSLAEQRQMQAHQHIRAETWRNIWNDSARYSIKFEYRLELWTLEYNHDDFTKSIIEIKGEMDRFYDFNKVEIGDSDTNGFTLTFITNDAASKVTTGIYRIITDAIEQVKEEC